MTEFVPLLLYKSPGRHHRRGKTFSYCGVSSQKELNEKLAAGWFLSFEEAVAAKQTLKPAPVVAPPADDVALDAPPTRDELLAKAKELGIGFNRRTTDAALLARISEKLNKREAA